MLIHIYYFSFVSIFTKGGLVDLTFLFHLNSLSFHVYIIIIIYLQPRVPELSFTICLYHQCNTTVWSGYPYQIICLICLNYTKYSTIAWPWVFRVESCVWLCHGFLGLNPGNGAKYNTMVCTIWACILGMVPNIVP